MIKQNKQLRHEVSAGYYLPPLIVATRCNKYFFHLLLFLIYVGKFSRQWSWNIELLLQDH